jgi:SAM-dependent methyltransferase
MAVDHACRRAAAAGIRNVHFRVGDIRELDEPPASYDAILAMAVLHHLDNEAIFATLCRGVSLLKPGGVLLSNDPNIRRLIGVFRSLFADKYRTYHSPDERELEPQELFHLFIAARFERVQVHYNDFFLGPLAWLCPNFPQLLAGAASAADSMLLSVPGLRSRASSFCVVGWRAAAIPRSEA